MKLTRRQAVQLFGAAASAMAVSRAFSQSTIQVTPGRFSNTRDSLKSYVLPDWFGDAKFGIWSHWGPQSAVGDGDWYARNMYIEGSEQYEYHVKRFGPQSKVGYKDLVPLFTADKWDPEHLMDLYQKAGAKYFFSMGVHHDNFDLWNSKYQPRWNAVASGPKKRYRRPLGRCRSQAWPAFRRHPSISPTATTGSRRHIWPIPRVHTPAFRMTDVRRLRRPVP